MGKKKGSATWFSVELGEKLRESVTTVAIEGEKIVIRLSIPPSVDKAKLAASLSAPELELWDK